MLLKNKESEKEEIQSSNGLPEISPKEITLNSNLMGEKKAYQYRTSQRRSERESYSIVKSKRR